MTYVKNCSFAFLRKLLESTEEGNHVFIKKNSSSVLIPRALDSSFLSFRIIFTLFYTEKENGKGSGRGGDIDLRPFEFRSDIE